jgi:hypothetical protein
VIDDDHFHPNPLLSSPLTFRGYDKMYDEQSDGLAERRANPLQVGAALTDCAFYLCFPPLLQLRAIKSKVSAATQSRASAWLRCSVHQLYVGASITDALSLPFLSVHCRCPVSQAFHSTPTITLYPVTRLPGGVSSWTSTQGTLTRRSEGTRR